MACEVVELDVGVARHAEFCSGAARCGMLWECAGWVGEVAEGAARRGGRRRGRGRVLLLKLRCVRAFEFQMDVDELGF